MKNKLIFRILGALASALIIVSVFIPFVSVTGYSQSLWQAHSSVGTLYLPIMIIVFGAIGVIFFSINIKTELAYASSGALTFFLIMQTIPIIDQGTFDTLSVGYYCLVVGTILTGIMAFICNLRTKQKQVQNVSDVAKPISMIDQIDKLYSDQVNSTNDVQNVIQPIPIQATVINDTNTISVESNVTPVNEIQNANVEQVTNSSNVQVQETLNQPTIANNNLQQDQMVNTSNPVISEFNAPTQNVNVAQSNPVVSEFSQPVNNQQQTAPAQIAEQPIVQSNPVVAEFSQPMQQPAVEPVIPVMEQTQVAEPVQPINEQPKIDVMSEQQPTNQSNLDIFG